MPPEPSDAVTVDDTPVVPAPAKGRPRSEAVSQSILEAALDLIAEHGTVADVSVEAIADRSGVSKATIYRRWASKEELLAAAIESVKAPLPTSMPRTSLREDLVHIGHSMRRTFSDRETKIVKCMMLAVKEDPEYQRHHDRLVERRRRFIRDTFAHWAERGELSEKIDLDLAVAMFAGPMLQIFVYGQYPQLQEAATVEGIVDNLLDGIGA